MPEEHGDTVGLEARLEREVTELGPLVRRRRQVETREVNPEYAAALRVRLMAMQPADIETETVPPVPTRTAVRPRTRTRWTIVATAVAAVLIVVLLTHRLVAPRHPVAIATPGPTSIPIIAIAVPTPSTLDLLRAYPAGGGGGGVTSPEQSLFDIPGVSYAGHVRIVGLAPGVQPRVAGAFRLASPQTITSRISRLRQQLGIHNAPTRAANPVDHTPWFAASDGGAPSNAPLHSIAVSLQTGELIFHNAPSQSRRVRSLDSTQAVTFARRWLSRLGWPAAGMSVQSTVSRPQMFPPSVGTPWEVNLGWAGTGIDAVAAATLLVMPDGRIFEARVWPPVAHRGAVRTGDVVTAWRAIRADRVPIAIEGMADQQPVNAVATLRRVDVVEILVTAPGRGAYLVPAYRFTGVARLQNNAGVKVWYGLASALR